MNRLRLLNSHKSLLVGLSALPSFYMTAILLCLQLFGWRGSSSIPAWAWLMDSATLPLAVGIVGLGLWYCLALLASQKRLATWRFTRAGLVFFAVIWNVVFGYLSFVVHAAGLGDGPGAISVEQFLQRLATIVFFGFPGVTVISLIVCSFATSIFLMVLQVMNPSFNSVPKLGRRRI